MSARGCSRSDWCGEVFNEIKADYEKRGFRILSDAPSVSWDSRESLGTLIDIGRPTDTPDMPLASLNEMKALLARAQGAEGKHYFFGHFLLPHFPWTMGKDCRVNPTDDWRAPDVSGSSDSVAYYASMTQGYWQQTYCAHRRILETVDALDAAHPGKVRCSIPDSWRSWTPHYPEGLAPGRGRASRGSMAQHARAVRRNAAGIGWCCAAVRRRDDAIGAPKAADCRSGSASLRSPIPGRTALIETSLARLRPKTAAVTRSDATPPPATPRETRTRPAAPSPARPTRSGHAALIAFAWPT